MNCFTFQTFGTGGAVDVSPLNPFEDTVDVPSLVYLLVASRAVPREQLVPELREDQIELVAGFDFDAVGRVGPLVEVEAELEWVSGQIHA